MRWLLSVFALASVGLLFGPAASAQALFVGVVPDLSVGGPGDEGFALAPTGPPVDLAGWSVSDGEGSWPLPPTLLAKETWFVGDRGAWSQRDGPTPAASFGTALRLANGGDDLHLIDARGREVDAFTYGDALSFAGADLMWRRMPAGGDGLPDAGGHYGMERRVAAAEDGASGGGRPDEGGHGWAAPFGWIDTDTDDDWRTPRIHRVGESRLTMPTFSVDGVTAYASPDSSFEVLTSLIDEASQRLHLHVYELRSRALADHLAAAAARGVDVEVLVTARPVGQEPAERHETAHALHGIEAAGGTAVVAEGGRYRYHHLKVLVADDAVAVQSENWVASGVPADPSWGNRGWGVVLHDGEAADWFAAWMAADRGAWDAVPFTLEGYDPLFEPPPRFGTPAGEYRANVPPRYIAGPVQVRPVVTPDATADPRFDPTFAAIAGARDRVWTQQLDVTSAWSNEVGWSGPDGLHDGLGQAAGRGLDVRVMAAAPFRLDDTGNAEAMALLRPAGVATCTFTVADLVLHNKGTLTDDTVYVGSMNGNHHSRSMNREVGVLVDDARISAYFGRLFQADWEACPTAAFDAATPAVGPMLFALTLVVGAKRCSRPSRSWPSSSSPPASSSPGASGSSRRVRWSSRTSRSSR